MMTAAFRNFTRPRLKGLHSVLPNKAAGHGVSKKSLSLSGSLLKSNKGKKMTTSESQLAIQCCFVAFRRQIDGGAQLQV